MERTKMPRKERAKQFAPFDALKGLQDALRIKEYEHERIVKGDVTEEQAEKISKILRELTKDQIVEVTYFCDGHNLKIKGKAKLNIAEQTIQIDKLKIKLDDIYNIDIAI